MHEKISESDREIQEEVEIGITDTFTERIATNVVVAHTPEGFFIFEFLRPKAVITAGKDGKIRGFKGELKSDVRIFLSPITVKRLLRTLEDQIKKYESKFGEIIPPEPEEKKEV